MKPQILHRHIIAAASLLLAFPWDSGAQILSGGGSGGSSGGASGGASTGGGISAQGTAKGQGADQNSNGRMQPANNQSGNNAPQSGNSRNPTQPQLPGTTPQGVNGSNRVNGQANIGATPLTGTNTTGTTQQQGGSASGMANVQGGAADTTYGGTISAFGANGFSLLDGPNGATTNFLIGPDTVFTDSEGRIVPRERFNNQVPAKVFYVRSGNQMIATRVVANESPAVFSAGTLTEVSPGILVIKRPDASLTPVEYVHNETTNYVDQNGRPVSPASVKPGTPVRVFYTKVGNTLIASKVEVHPGEVSGLPISAMVDGKPVSTEATTTKTTIKREVKR